jgi:hypothetical protein
VDFEGCVYLHGVTQSTDSQPRPMHIKKQKTAKVMRFTVPGGMGYLGSSKDIGSIAYDPVTRTVTWAVDTSDPYFSVQMRVLKASVFGLQLQISSRTYDPTINSVMYRTLTTSEKAVDTSGNSNTSVNAATTTGTSSGVGVNAASSTVPMQTTGFPLVGLVLAVLMLAGGMVTSKK